MTRRPKLSSLSGFVMPYVEDAVKTAVGKSGAIDVEMAVLLVETVLRSPSVRRRVQAASPHERVALDAEIQEFVRELDTLGFAPPSLLIPERADKENVEPPGVRAMLREAFATVIARGDKALADSADGDPPTQDELEEWLAKGQAPEDTLGEVARRLGVQWDLEPHQVKVVGWTLGCLATSRNGVGHLAPAADLVDNAIKLEIPNPLVPLIQGWQDREPADFTSRHLQVVGRYTKTPALLATTSGQLEIVQVDGEPFAGRQPLMPKGRRTKAYRPAQPAQGELIAGPATIDGVPAGDLLLVGLDQLDLADFERTTLRHDIMKLGRAAYALTGKAIVPEDVGARWLTGQEHATETAKRRWWDTLAVMRGLTVRVDPKTHRWLGMFDVDPRTSGAVWFGPPAWWVEDRAVSGPRSWRLSGGLWRRPTLGDTPARGTAAGYWGALARTVDGIEAALTWGPTAGKGPGGRIPDNLKPVSPGGPGPEVFIPWRNVLRLAGERAPDDDTSSTLRVRYKRRLEYLAAAGLVKDGQAAAPAGDTVEVVRVVDGRRKGASGIYVRATARFVEAYRLGQNSKEWELLPSSRLFLPDGSEERLQH